jgi:hypothetical protein
MRNTHMHAQVGVTRWARQDSNLTTENTSNDIENEENEQSALGGVSKSASLIDKSEQMLQLLALLRGLSSDEIELLLRLADKLKQIDA